MSQVIRSTIGALLLSAISVACSSESREKTEVISKVDEPEAGEVIAWVKADLNGDGMQDLATLVPYEFVGENATKGYEQVAAWPYCSEGQAPSGPAGGGPVVLVIDHGQNATKKIRKGFLLYDPNNVSVLATDAATHLSSAKPEELSGKGVELKELPERFSGEVLVLPTEAGIDTFIYWTGTTYRAFEPLELP